MLPKSLSRKTLAASTLLLSAHIAQAQQVTLFRTGVIVLPYYTTIDAAIKSAKAGDSLVMSAHRFKEHDLQVDKDLKFTGTVSGTASTIIDAESKGRGFYVTAGNVDFQSLTITNGKITDGAGGGVYNIGTGDISFHGNAQITYCGAYGIYANGGAVFSSGKILMYDSSMLSNNYAAESAGGAYGYSTVGLFDKARIANNRTDGSGGGIFSVANNGIQLSGHCMVDHNTAAVAGGGFYGVGNVKGYASVNDNKADFGGGIAAFSDAIFLEDSSLVMNNTATTNGGGIWLNNCNLYGLDQFRIIGNQIPAVTGTLNFGGAIYNVNGNVQLYGGTITGNRSPVAAIYNSAGASPMTVDINACHIYNPKADGTRMPEVYNSPALTSSALSFKSTLCWWGSNDTSKLIADRPGRNSGRMTSFVKLKWHLNNDVPVTASMTRFPLSAELKGNNGEYLDSISYRSIRGNFTATKGSFSDAAPKIDTSNYVKSIYTAPAATGVIYITANVDADTFRSAAITVRGTQINEQATTNLVKIYPNPASELLFIQDAPQGTSISILDLTGRKQSTFLSTATVQEISLSGLNAGFYFVQLQFPDGTATTAKILKQ